MIIPAVAGGIIGTGIVTGASKVYHKVTGKPAGKPGTMAHILTNDKLDSKPAVFVEQTKESAKDILTLGGITFGAAATGSLAAGTSKNVAKFLSEAKAKVGSLLDDVIVNSQGKSVKEIIKSSKLFEKFNKLPMPAKAGILAGALALAIVAPIVTIISAQKNGYIEGKHEVK